MCLRLLLALVSTAPLVPANAWAAGASAHKAASTLAARATQAFRAGDFAHALTDFEEAVTLVERGQGEPGSLPVLRFNLARCLEELGRPAEAIAAFERYLALPDSETAKARATERIQALENRHFARLRVECVPAAGELFLNGHRAGRCGEPLRRLTPGVTEVNARSAAGGLHVKRTYTLMAGVETTATLTFGGRIEVAGVQGDVLEVRVDGQPVAGPPYVTEVESGLHRVEVSASDGRGWQRDVRLAPGAVQRLQSDLDGAAGGVSTSRQSEAGQRSPWPWVAFGGAAVALGGAAFFWADTLDSTDAAGAAVDRHNEATDVDQRAQARRQAETARSEVESDRSWVYGLGAAALVCAGVGGYLLYSDAQQPVTSGLSAGPGGVSFRGSF